MSQELEGTLINTAELIAEQTSDEFNYNDFDHKPQINGVELIGNKTSEDLGIDIPTKTSELENDSGFITEADVPTKTSELQNDSGFITSADVPTKTSELQNDSGFITSADVPTKTSELQNDSGFITSADVPTKTSELDNDSGFITGDDYYDKSEIDTALSAKADKSDTYTKTETDNKIVGLIDDTTTANNKAWSSSKITDEIINILPTGTASGSVASFNTSLALPLVSAKFAVNASQESGTPTPSTPKAISGWSAVTLDVNGTIEVINLGGTCYGGEITQDKDGHRQFKVTHNVVDLSTLSGWSRITNYANPIFRANLPSDCFENKSSSTPQFAICSAYAWYSSNQNYYDYMANYDFYCAAYGLSSVNRIYFRNDDYSDTTSFISSLNGVKMVYKLATPTIIDLPDGTPIITLIGANSISADSGNTEVVYKESINDAIAELQALFLS